MVRDVLYHALISVLLYCGILGFQEMQNHGQGISSGAVNHHVDPAMISVLSLIPVGADDIHKVIRDSPGVVTLINVWATWCQPCREEMPDLLKVYREFRDRGISLILISGDFPEDSLEVKHFLQHLGVNFRTYIKSGRDMPFINALSPKWSGALPATFIYNQADSLVNYWEGKASYNEFVQAINQVLHQ